MKIPRRQRTYCPKCRTHTEHAVSLYKAGRRKAAKQGERRQAERKKGYGGQKYPMQHNQAKVSRKQSLILNCRECGYKITRAGIRLRRLEIE